MKKVLILLFLAGLLLPFTSKAETCSITINCGNCISLCNSSCGREKYPRESFLVKDRNLYNKLRGRILVLPQRNGEAYYVHPSNYSVYYLGNSINALEVMQSLGYGTYNRDLDKVWTGVLYQYGTDSDMDGLSDNFEMAVGTNRFNFNSDFDVYSDKMEIIAGYDPNGSGKMPISKSFIEKNKGRVLLATENYGQAWYVNPVDGKKYYLSNQFEMSVIINKFGLGISNGNFNKLVQ